MDLSPPVPDPDDRTAPHGVEGGVGSGSVRGPSVVLPIRRGAAAILVIALAVSACGGSSASAAPSNGSGNGSGSASSTAPNASSPADPSAGPTDGAQPTDAASPAAGGNGGTGNGAIPALSDGQWTAGKAHADVTGDVSDNVDGTIMESLAITTDQNTTLMYFSADATKQIAVALAGGTASVSVTTPSWVGGGGTTAGAECNVSFTKTDDKALAGTVTCTKAPVLTVGSLTADQFADMNVTFDATR